jgi:hypothetical protein
MVYTDAEWAGCLETCRSTSGYDVSLRANLIYFSTNLIQHQCMKHVEIDLHFVRECMTIGDVCVLHVPMTFQFINIFMKGLPTSVFSEFRCSLNIFSG